MYKGQILTLLFIQQIFIKHPQHLLQCQVVGVHQGYRRDHRIAMVGLTEKASKWTCYMKLLIVKSAVTGKKLDAERE